MKNMKLSIDPFLARKIEVIAGKRKTTFADTVLFLIQAVISPRKEAYVKNSNFLPSRWYHHQINLKETTNASESDREEDRGEGAREPGDAGAEPGEGVQRPRACAEERA